MLTSAEMAKIAVKALDDKKAKEIKLLKTKDVTVLADYFVICTATSTTQVRALADYVEVKLKHDYDIVPHHTEGFESNSWVLIDYGSVLLHVFLPEAREFYNLERLWKDGNRIALSELGIEDVH